MLLIKIFNYFHVIPFGFEWEKENTTARTSDRLFVSNSFDQYVEPPMP